MPHNCLFEQKENDSNLFGIYLGNLEKKQLIVKADGWQMECDNVLSPEQWQHLAVTMDPTSSRNPMRIYVNNQNLKGTIDKPADGVMYTLKDIDADAVVGTGFIGKMDELMVWRNARTTFTSDMDGTLTSAVFPGRRGPTQSRWRGARRAPRARVWCCSGARPRDRAPWSRR